MELIEFLGQNSDAIQAIVAILNFGLIGLLTYIGIKLQNKNYSMELYSKIQQEIIVCIGEINECVQYFRSKELNVSQYLQTLDNYGAGDPDNEQLAQKEIKNLRDILYKLKIIKIMIEDGNTLIDLRNPNNEQLIYELSKINSFKVSFINNSPIKMYDSCIKGADAVWLDGDSCITNAYDETIQILEGLEDLLGRHD